MVKTPRIIELPPKPTSQLTTELQPAYERPLDQASLDARMHDQLGWEAQGRTTPRAIDPNEFVTLNGPGAERKRKVSIKRLLALGALVVVGAAAAVGLIERAHHQQQQSYKPATPELADQPKK